MDKKIPAEVNGVHPTTIRAQRYEEVSVAQVMCIKLSDGSNLIICLGPKPDTVSQVFFLNEKYSGNIAPRHHGDCSKCPHIPTYRENTNTHLEYYKMCSLH